MHVHLLVSNLAEPGKRENGNKPFVQLRNFEKSDSKFEHKQYLLNTGTFSLRTAGTSSKRQKRRPIAIRDSQTLINGEPKSL